MSKTTDEYYGRLSILDQLRRSGSIDDLLVECEQSVELLPQLVEDLVRQFGEFAIQGIPALDYLRRFAPIRGDHRRLELARTIVDPVAELAPFRTEVTKGLENLEAVRVLRPHLEAHPGATQAGLARQLGLDGRAMAGLLKDMELDGQLNRERSGETWCLSITGPAKPAPPERRTAAPKFDAWDPEEARERASQLLGLPEDTGASAVGPAWEATEKYAARYLQLLGYDDASLGARGADGGVDVNASRAVAQVKATAKRVGRPQVQQLSGIATHRRVDAYFFSTSGYTSQAIAWADQAGVALFALRQVGAVIEVIIANQVAIRVAERAHADPRIRARIAAEQRLALVNPGSTAQNPGCFSLRLTQQTVKRRPRAKPKRRARRRSTRKAWKAPPPSRWIYQTPRSRLYEQRKRQGKNWRSGRKYD